MALDPSQYTGAAKAAAGQPAPRAVGLPAGVKEVQRIAAPGGGFYVLGSDGGVFAISDDQGRTPQFYGSYGNLAPEQRQGQRAFTGIELNPTGGYSLTSDKGERYDFDTNTARGLGLNVPDQGSTVTSDPAFLAFLRTSGLSLETAANQVRQQTGAINAGLQTARGDIDFNAGENRRKTAGSYESRGVIRSSTHQQAQDRVERDRLNQVAAKEGQAATQISGLNQGLVQQVLGQQQKAAELGLNTAQSQDYDAEVNRIKKKYASELSAGGLSV